MFKVSVAAKKRENALRPAENALEVYLLPFQPLQYASLLA